jgi:hypothetical protein
LLLAKDLLVLCSASCERLAVRETSELRRACGILTGRPSEQVGVACHILLHVACTVRKVLLVNYKFEQPNGR